VVTLPPPGETGAETKDPTELRDELAKALAWCADQRGYGYRPADEWFHLAHGLLPLIEAREAKVRRETLEAAADDLDGNWQARLAVGYDPAASRCARFLRARAATGGPMTHNSNQTITGGLGT
jgi:hypothetical protein